MTKSGFRFSRQETDARAVRLTELLDQWPTLLVLIGCYAFWLSSLIWHQQLGIWWMIPAILSVALHSSLQHEILHGHPTRNPSFNELLVFPALGIFIPFRRYRQLHLRHHRDQLLTDPYEDPESWYLSADQWKQSCRMVRVLLDFNATLAGRVILGPMLSIIGFYHSEYKLVRQGKRHVALAWYYHCLGLLPVIFILLINQIPLWYYVVAVAYPALSVLMIRSFIEHRAADEVSHRTAIVEAGWFMSLLFLNNNLHAVHHRHPREPWFRLPSLWSRERLAILSGNAHYHVAGGYMSVARQWLLRRREPVQHPFDRDEGADGVTLHK